MYNMHSAYKGRVIAIVGIGDHNTTYTTTAEEHWTTLSVYGQIGLTTKSSEWHSGTNTPSADSHLYMTASCCCSEAEHSILRNNNSSSTSSCSNCMAGGWWCSAGTLISASVFDVESVSVDTPRRDAIASSALSSRSPVSKSVTGGRLTFALSIFKSKSWWELNLTRNKKHRPLEL